MKRLYTVIRRLLKPVSLTYTSRIVAFVALIAICLTGQTNKHQYSPREKAFYADPALVDFVRPGLSIKINSASISSAGAITVNYTITDPAGLPLDATGKDTPGAVVLTYFAAYIPSGQEQYVAYTTAPATGKVLGTVTRPTFEIGGVTLTSLGSGQYQYVMKSQAPAGFDASATTTIGMNGTRDLSSFNLGTSYGADTFSFVPNGAAVTVTRDVIKTASCNGCHDQLVFHGAHAFGMEQCVLCHQPQNVDPTTGNTLDLKVMIHKIHRGSSLPSVVGTSTTPGVPYQIAGFGGRISDFSDVVDPADVRRCGVCHDQTTKAAQANVFLTKPTRAACGSCHDNVNFDSGANHVAGFQKDDTQCANCHIPQGEMPFDASIMGAHVVPTDTKTAYPQNPNTLLAGLNFKITGVTNTSAGKAPTVNFTLQDDSGNNIAPSKLGSISFTMAGPSTDYGYTSFGSDTSSTPGYVTESAAKASCDSGGACSYTFTHTIPAAATGTFAIGGEARIVETVLAGTTSQQSVQYGAINPVVNFSVDGSKVSPRRTVVALSNCNSCHVQLSLHGTLRNQVEYCVMCHNPSNSDFTQRPSATVGADKTQPNQGINMALMVHRIHNGVNGPANGEKNPYIIVGFRGSHNDFSDVGYPAMSPTGAVAYTQNCSMCHVNGSEQKLPIGLNAVADPQGWTTPAQATASACSGCHVSKGEAAHFAANTDPNLGESCSVCHAAGAQFAVDAEHTQ